MNEEEFKKKVQQELKKLDIEQITHFAWRCAVRALPFLGSNGNFDFWKKKDRQKHIYSIFYALDINAAANRAAKAADSTDNTDAAQSPPA